MITESGANTDAFRHEPDFYNRYLKPYKIYAGENPRRISSSYGPLQIMWSVATERGYPATEPPEKLFIPEVGLHWGCAHIRFLADWAAGFPNTTPQQQLDATIASYNGGRGGNKPTDSPKRNMPYVRKVLANLDLLKKQGAAA